MDRKIELKALSSSKSTMGAPVKTYVHSCYKMASREKAGESPENYVNSRLVRAQRYKYTVHYDSSVDETMQLVDDGVAYNILSVDPAGSLFLEILAERIIE